MFFCQRLTSFFRSHLPKRINTAILLEPPLSSFLGRKKREDILRWASKFKKGNTFFDPNCMLFSSSFRSCPQCLSFNEGQSNKRLRIERHKRKRESVSEEKPSSLCLIPKNVILILSEV